MSVSQLRARTIGRRFTALLSVSAMVLALLTVVGVNQAAAAGSTRLVSPAGSDSGDCQDTACLTIGYAIGIANGGDTIQVAAGTYHEAVAVNKQVTIKGAQAGIDATGRTPGGAGESVIDASGAAGANAISVTADNVTIDGFEMKVSATGSDVWMKNHNTGETIANNILHAGAYAVMMDSSATTVAHNSVYLIATSVDGVINQTGPGSNWTVSGNSFQMETGQTIGNGYGADVNYSGDDPITAGQQQHVVVTGNISTSGGTLAAVAAASDVTISGNTSTGANASAIYLGGDVSNATISQNTISGALRAVKIDRYSTSYGPNTDVTVGPKNKLTGGADLLYVSSGAYSGDLTAATNWWGSGAGPTAAQVATNGATVTTAPWCDEANCSSTTSTPTRYVDPDGTDAPDCASPSAPCKTINYAIGQANAGDTIKVTAGDYNENVAVSKSVVLKGANAGVSGTGTRGGESTISPAAGVPVTVTADNATISGFTINAPSGPNADAVVMQGANTGEAVSDNIINAAARAVNLRTSSTTITDNLINLSAGSPNGIEANSNPGDGLTITNNTFHGATSAQGDITIVGGSPKIDNVTISGNIAEGPTSGTLVAVFNATNVAIHGNVATDESGSVVYLGGGVAGAQVTDNTISGTTGTAISIANNYGDGANSDVTVSGNSLTSNGTDLNIGTGAYTGTLNAANNWWGSAHGPSDGDVTPVGASVTLSPWCDVADCATTASAGARYVATNGTDSGVCADPDHPCESINYAISQAVAGDTINVAAGTYSEAVALTKPLTLSGSTDANNPTILDGSALTGPAGNAIVSLRPTVGGPVTVENFTFTNPMPATGSGGEPVMLFVKAAGNDVIIRNNKFIEGTADSSRTTNYPVGIWMYNSNKGSNAYSTTVDGNTFDGMAQGLLLEGVRGPVTVTNNDFKNLITSQGYAPDGVVVLTYENTQPTGYTSDTTIDHNTFESFDGNAVGIDAGYGTSGPGHVQTSITDNTFALTGTDGNSAAAVSVKTAVTGSSVTATVTGNTGYVSGPSSPFVVSNDPTNIAVTASGNTIAVGNPNDLSIDFTPPTQVIANDQPLAFGGVVHNASTSTVPNARYDVTLSGITGLKASDLTLQFKQGTSWVTAPLTDNTDGTISGYLEDQAGFSLAPGSFTMDLQVSVRTGAPTGTLHATATLVQVAPDGTPLDALTGSVSHETSVTTLTVPGCPGSLATGAITPTAFNMFYNANTTPALDSATRSNGHYLFTSQGLRFWTDGASQTEPNPYAAVAGQGPTRSSDKVAGYVVLPTPMPLGEVGTPAWDLVDNMNTGAAGFQLTVDNGHGIVGNLVQEAVYGSNIWWSGTDFGVGGAGGYASWASLSDYLNRWPDMKVIAYGFSLGSGIHGDNTIKNFTVGCTTYDVTAGTGSITGIVTEQGGSNPLGGVVVTASVTGSDGTTVLATGSATTAADGAYTISGLPASNSYAVHFNALNATGGDSQTGYQSTDAPSATTVAAGAPTNVPAELAVNKGRIAGTVTASSGGAPLAGVTVTATGPSPAPTAATTTTDGAGHYSLPDLAAGTYSVTFTRPGFYNQTAGSTAVANGHITTANVGLVQQGNTVAGTVTNASTSAVMPGVAVRLKDATSLTWLQTTTTDANGTYTFGGVADNANYIVCFWQQDFVAQCSTAQTMGIGGQQTANAALAPVATTSDTAWQSSHAGWTNDPDPAATQGPPSYQADGDPGHSGTAVLNFKGTKQVDYYHAVANLPLDQVTELSARANTSEDATNPLTYQLRIYGALNSDGNALAANHGFSTLYTLLPATGGAWQTVSVALDSAQWISSKDIHGVAAGGSATLAQIAQANPNAAVVLYGVFRGGSTGAVLTTDALADDISINGQSTNFEIDGAPAPTDMTSKPSALNGWTNDPDNTAATYSFGPSGSDGAGSLKVSVTAATGVGSHVDWFHSVVADNTSFSMTDPNAPTIPLAGVQGLGMKIYVGSGSLPPSFQLRIVGASPNGDPTSLLGSTGFASLNWEPAYNTGVPAPVDGWITLSQLENGKWWSTKPINGMPNVQSSTNTLAQIAIDNPQARIYAYGVNLGSGATASTDYVDDVTFNGQTTNFEPDVVTISGTVTGDAGLAGVKVTVRDSDGHWAINPNTVTTDSSGHYSVTDLPGGTYQVCFVKAGYQADCESVTGTVGTVSSLDVDLMPAPNSTNTSTPLVLGGWAKDNDPNITAPSYVTVTGADGVGALDFEITADHGALSYFHQLANVPLDQVTEAGFKTNTPAGPAAPAYQLSLCGTTSTKNFSDCPGFTTLVMDTLPTSGWQPIDAFAGQWYSTNALTGMPVAGVSGTHATLADIVANNPGAYIRAYGVFRGSTTGTPTPGHSYVDDISFNGVTTDFEPLATPSATGDVATVTTPNGWTEDTGGTVGPRYTPLTDGDANGAINLHVVAKQGDGSTQDANSYASSYYHDAGSVPLGAIAEMGFAQKAANTAYPAVYQLRINGATASSGTGEAANDGFTTLVWAGDTATGDWQTESIDPVTSLWYSTRDINGLVGGFAATATLPEIIAMNPGAVVTQYGVFRGSTSGNWPTSDGYVDQVSFNGHTTDFRAIALNSCPSTSYAALPAGSWDFSQTRATGHNVFLPDGGLHVWTESNTSTDKAAGYLNVGHVALADVGDALFTLADVTGTPPGFQILLDNGVGVAGSNTGGNISGLIVGEPSFYGDNWWGADNVDWQLGIVVGGGGSSTTNAPLQAYLNRWPDAFVTQIGYSLGSGVKGDAVINALTFNCTTDYPMPAASTEVTTPLVAHEWANDPDGTVAPHYVTDGGALLGSGSLDLQVNNAADDGGIADSRAASYYHPAGNIPLTEALTMGYSEALQSDPLYRTVYQLRINGATASTGTGEAAGDGFTTLVWKPDTAPGSGWTSYVIDPATAKWVSTRAINGLAGGQAGDGLTLAQIQARNPEATITLYGVFRGSTDGSYPTGHAAVDAVVFNALTTNFEPLAVATSTTTITSRPSDTQDWDADHEGSTNPVTVTNADAVTELGHAGLGAINLHVVQKVGDGSGQDPNTYGSSYYRDANTDDPAAGVPLGDITELSFDQRAVDPDLPSMYQLRITGAVGGGTGGFTTLIWAGDPATGAWQHEAIDPTTAQWYSTRDIAGLSGGVAGGNTATLAQIIAANPNAVVVQYGVWRGSTSGNWPTSDGLVDDVSFNGTVTDFEPDVASVSGTVTSAATNAPIDNATVTITTTGGTAAAATVHTDSTGAYHADGLPLGSYQASFTATGYAAQVVTGQNLTSANLAVNAVLVPAHLPTVAVSVPPSITVGATPGLVFTGTTANPSDGVAYGNVRFDFTITGPSGLTASQLTLEYWDGSAYQPISLSGTGTITGHYGPAGGFPLPAPYTATTQFRVSATAGAPVGPLTVHTTLDTVDPANGNATIYTLATDVDTSTLAAQPTLAVTLPDYLIVGGDYREFTGTLTNPAAGASYPNARYDFALSVPAGVDAADLTLQYQQGSSWLPVPLTDGLTGSNTVTGSYGPAGGFALPAGATNTTLFRVKVAPGATPGAVTSANELNTVTSGGAVTGTLATAAASTQIVAGPSITLGQPSAVTAGALPVEYSGSVGNPAAADGGTSYPLVRYDFAITGPAGFSVSDIEKLQYLDGATWKDLAYFNGTDPNTVKGYFGPSTGFPLAAGALNTTQFRIQLTPTAHTGTLTTVANLNAIDGSGVVTATLATVTAVTTVYPAPTMSIGFPATLNTGAAATAFSGTAHNPSTASIPDARYDVRIHGSAQLAVGDVVLEYYDPATSSWQQVPLTVSGADLVGYFGPAAGFPLPSGDSTTQLRVAAGAGAPTGTLVTTVDLDQVEGTTPAITLSTTSGTTTVVAGLASVNGTVTDPTGQPLTGVDVSLFSAAAPHGHVATVQTVAGAYTFDNLAADDYWLCFSTGGTVTGGDSQTGYVGECWDNQPTSDTPTTLHLGPSTTTTANAVLAEHLGWITGTVTDSVTGEPLAGSTVSIGSQSATSAADGTFTIKGVADGTATVSAAATGYAGASVSAVAATGTIVTAPTLALAPEPGSISGTVKDSANGPIEDATVTVVAAGGSMAGTSSTDAAGHYSVTNLPADTSYTACAFAAGSQTHCLTGAGAVAVGPGQAVTQDFTLAALTTGAAISRPSAPGGWFGDPDTADPAYDINPSYGPEPGHSGLGALSLDISSPPAASSWWQLVNGGATGTGLPLGQVSQIGYAQQGSGTTAAAAYELVLCDTTSGDHGAAANGCDNYTRIVLDGPVAGSAWSTVAPDLGTAQWWSTRDLTGLAKNGPTATLAQIIANNPDARVIWYGVFRGHTNGTPSADPLRLDDISFNGTTTDFEPDVTTVTLSAINDDQAVSAFKSVSLTVMTADNTVLYQVTNDTSSVSGDTASIVAPNIPVGPYQVCVSGTSVDGAVLVPVDGNPCESVTVTLAGPNTPTVHLQQQRGKVAGTVTSGTANVSGATVTVYRADGSTAGTGTSLTDGTYTVPGLAPGIYTACVSADGYLSQCYQRAVKNVTVPSGGTAAVDFALTAVAATPVTSRPSALAGWLGDTPDTAPAVYVVNPTYQPEAGHSGLGSLLLDITTQTASSWWRNVSGAVKLDAVTQVGFNQSVTGTQGLTYQLVLCGTTSGDNNAADCPGYARLIWIPTAPATSAWTMSSADLSSAQWYATRSLTGLPTPYSSSATLAQIFLNNPNATVAAYGVFRGTTSAGSTTADRALVDDVEFNGTVTDFEPDVATTTLSAVNDDQSVSPLDSVSLTVKAASGQVVYTVTDDTSSVSGDTASVTTPNVPVGSYQVCITGKSADGATLVPADGNTCDTVNVTLAGPNSFSIHLMQVPGTIAVIATNLDQAASALATATVTVKDSGGSTVFTGPATVAGATASLTTPALPVGTYQVCVTGADAAAHTLVPSDGQPCVTVTVTSGQAAPARVDLIQTPGAISGTVTDAATHQPIVGATVTVSGQSPVTTGAGGSYTVSGLRVGDYTVTAGAHGYLQGSTPVTVSSGQTATGDIPLTAAPQSIQGAVTAGGNPVGGASVTVLAAGGSAAGSDVTAADGTYAVTVQPGTYTVCVASAGLVSDCRTGVVVAAGAATTGVNFALAALAPSTVISRPSALAGWFGDTPDTTKPNYVVNPTYQPESGHSGIGSLSMDISSTPAASSWWQNVGGAGLPLAQLSRIGLSQSVTGSAPPTYQLVLCHTTSGDNNAANCPGYTRIIWIPTTPATSAWTTSTADLATAQWYATRGLAGMPTPYASSATLAQIVANNPDAVVVSYGVFRGATSGPSTTDPVLVDDVVFNGVTTDFEPDVATVTLSAVNDDQSVSAFSTVSLTVKTGLGGTVLFTGTGTVADGTIVGDTASTTAQDIPVGDYQVCITGTAADGHQLAPVDGSDCASVTVSLGGPNSATVHLYQPRGSVSGTVTGNGSPLAGATVTVRTGSTPVGSTTTGADGSYSVTGLVAGAYDVVVSDAPAWASATIPAVTVNQGADTSGVDADLAATPGAISGTVTGNGVPLSGASVTVKSGSTTVGSASTARDGTYLVSSLPAGSYTVEFADAPEWQPATSATIVVSAGQTHSGVDADLAAANGSISGAVVDADGHGVAGATVSVKQGATQITSVTAGPDGSYAASVAAGTYTVCASAATYLDGCAAAAVTVTAGGSATGVDVTLAAAPGGISGTVTGNGVPLSGASVTVKSGSTTVGSASTAGDGTYLVSSLPAGSYTVEFADAPEWQPATSATIVVSAGQTHSGVDADLAAAPGGISGTVTAAVGGAPISGVTVTVMNGATSVGTASTGSDGTYTVPNLPAGTYDVVFTDGVAWASKTVTGAVVAAGQSTTVNGALAANPGAIFGTVTGNGVPLSGASVTVKSGSTTVGSASTAGDGTYTVSSLPAGSYTVEFADAPEWQPTTSATIVVSAGQTHSGVDADLAAANGSISGTVTASSGGAGISGVTVTVKDGTDAVKGIATTDGNGAYSVPDLPAGPYTVEFVSSPGWVSQTASATVDQGVNTVVDAALVAANGSIVGTVTDADSHAAISGATVTVLAGLNTVGTGSSGADGSYTIPGIGLGNYTVCAVASGYAQVCQPASVTSASAVTVDFALSGRPGSISGTVSGGGGPLGQVTVTVTDSHGNPVVLPVTTDNDGTYTVPNVPAGTYSVVFTKSPTWASQTVDSVVVSPGGAVSGVDVTLVAAVGSISGTVTGNGSPVSGVSVTVKSGSTTVGSATTAGDGTYSVPNLPVGSYDVVFAKSPAWVSQTATGKVVAEGATTVVDAALVAANGSIAGTVTGNGSPVSGVSVTVKSGSTTVGTATTAGDGTYTVPDLPAGSYDVVFAKSPAWVSQTATGKVVAAGAATTVDAVLTAAKGSVTGTVTAAVGGAAIPGVTVTVKSGSTTVGTATTASDGTYTVPNVPVGSYDVVFAKSPAWVSQTATGKVVAAGAATTVDAVLSAANGSLSGTVTDYVGGAVLPGVVVTIKQGSTTKGTATTGTDGTYAVSGLAAGSYTVSFAAGGYYTATVSGTSVASGVDTPDVDAALLVIRIGGSSRYETAAMLATRLGHATSVIVANGEDYKGGFDALSANFLAGELGAPVLLTPSGIVPAVTLQAVTDVLSGPASGPRHIYLIGKTDSISAAAAAQLAAAYPGATVTRVAGNNRYATSAAVTTELGAGHVKKVTWSNSQSAVNTAIIATGKVSADALGAGPISYWGLPVLLTDGTTLAPEVKAALQSMGIQQVVILGTTSSVGTSVETELHALGIGSNRIMRIAGPNRYSTAAQLWDFAVSPVPSPSRPTGGLGMLQASGNITFLANGTIFADALAAGSLAGEMGNAAVLLTPQATLAPEAGAWLTAHKATMSGVVGLGKSASVSDAVLDAANAALH